MRPRDALPWPGGGRGGEAGTTWGPCPPSPRGTISSWSRLPPWRPGMQLLRQQWLLWCQTLLPAPGLQGLGIGPLQRWRWHGPPARLDAVSPGWCQARSGAPGSEQPKHGAGGGDQTGAPVCPESPMPSPSKQGGGGRGGIHSPTCLRGGSCMNRGTVELGASPWEPAPGPAALPVSCSPPPRGQDAGHCCPPAIAYKAPPPWRHHPAGASVARPSCVCPGARPSLPSIFSQLLFNSVITAKRAAISCKAARPPSASGRGAAKGT